MNVKVNDKEKKVKIIKYTYPIDSNFFMAIED